MKIIQVDNFDRETVSDILVAQNIKNELYAILMVGALNDKYSGDSSSVYFKLVPEDYELYKYDPS